jgi:undecaprenyl-diphosphatase
MDSLIVFTATYLIWIMVAGFAAVWLFAEDRRGKVYLGGSAVAGLVIVLIIIEIATRLYTDPRPFVVDAALPNLLDHAADNGFPSDHSSAAGLIAAVVALRHRWYGLLLGIAAVVVAWSRVAANAHHLTDVLAGLLFGAVAAVLGTLLVRLVLQRTRLLTLPPVVRLLGPPPAGPSAAPALGSGTARPEPTRLEQRPAPERPAPFDERTPRTEHNP